MRYNLEISNIAQLPCTMKTLQSQLNLKSSDNLKDFIIVSHFVAPKSDAKAFQYEISSFILYTDSKLYKIGFKVNDLYSFCKVESEALFHSFVPYFCAVVFFLRIRMILVFVNRWGNSTISSKYCGRNHLVTKPFLHSL